MTNHFTDRFCFAIIMAIKLSYLVDCFKSTQFIYSNDLTDNRVRRLIESSG